METKDLLELKQSQESCFRFLSVCFYLPCKEHYVEVEYFKNLAANMSRACPKAMAYVTSMEEGLMKYSEEELQVEYARLFVGPFELLAPPYGSVYIDEGQRVMGSSTLEVIKFYQNEGISKSEHFKDLPDHIAVELEFMSHLIHLELVELEKQDLESANLCHDNQMDFLNKFVCAWAPAFCKKITQATNNDFYTALAGCLSVFITEIQSDVTA